MTINNSNTIFITECPRDGQQGLDFVISPKKRAAYINELMQVGFDVIDFGSFVSPKVVPQMAESAKVLSLVDKTISDTKILAIVGNMRGAHEAGAQEKVDIIGFPYSISDTFLKKNINSGIDVVFQQTLELHKACVSGGKDFRVYISMAFGNPYGDAWSEEILFTEVKKLVENGINIITLSDTIGLGSANIIKNIFEKSIPLFPDVKIGLHLHCKPDEAYSKLEAAWNAGCRHFDGVINGYGGCPMTGYELLGNVNTLEILRFCKSNQIQTKVDTQKIFNVTNEYPDFNSLK